MNTQDTNVDVACYKGENAFSPSIGTAVGDSTLLGLGTAGEGVTNHPMGTPVGIYSGGQAGDISSPRYIWGMKYYDALGNPIETPYQVPPPGNWFSPAVITTNSTSSTWTGGFTESDRDELEAYRELGSVDEIEKVIELNFDHLEEKHFFLSRHEGLTKKDLFLAIQRDRMKEKGWTLAFLSPSVVEYLETVALTEYINGETRFIYDVQKGSETNEEE